MSNPMYPNDRRVYRKEEVVYDQNGVPLPPVQPVAPQPVYYEAPAPAPVSDARSTYADYGDAKIDNRREVYVDERGNVMEREDQVFDDPYTRRLNFLDRTARIVYFLVGALEVLLLLRFVFKLLGADPNSGLASFIYGLSNPFTAAFYGIFGDYKLGTNSYLELSTLIAMAIYALLAWGLVALLDAIFRPNPSSRQVISSTRRRL